MFQVDLSRGLLNDSIVWWKVMLGDRTQMVLCRVVDVKGERIELVVVGGDQKCLWADAKDVYEATTYHQDQRAR